MRTTLTRQEAWNCDFAANETCGLVARSRDISSRIGYPTGRIWNLRSDRWDCGIMAARGALTECCIELSSAVLRIG